MNPRGRLHRQRGPVAPSPAGERTPSSFGGCRDKHLPLTLMPRVSRKRPGNTPRKGRPPVETCGPHAPDTPPGRLDGRVQQRAGRALREPARPRDRGCSLCPPSCGSGGAFAICRSVWGFAVPCAGRAVGGRAGLVQRVEACAPRPSHPRKDRAARPGVAGVGKGPSPAAYGGGRTTPRFQERRSTSVEATVPVTPHAGVSLHAARGSSRLPALGSGCPLVREVSAVHGSPGGRRGDADPARSPGLRVPVRAHMCACVRAHRCVRGGARACPRPPELPTSDRTQQVAATPRSFPVPSIFLGLQAELRVALTRRRRAREE